MKKQKERKSQTQPSLEKDLDRMLFLAAEEKMLPKIIYDYSFLNKQPSFVNKYRESVREIYTKQTAMPLKYNENQAKTHREKFREQIAKLVNNQLLVDYLKPVKVNGKFVMTYKGHQLDKVSYPTNPEFAIFAEYSQNKFKNSFSDIFDDKLEFTEKSLITNPRKEVKSVFKTQPSSLIKHRMEANPNVVTKTTAIREQSTISHFPSSLPKLIPRAHMSSARNLLKKKPKIIKADNESAMILETMMRIGKYSSVPNNISVTKESIMKYIKQCYLRPHRIVDFLEFSDVETYPSFSKVPQKLKFMANQHISFMVFLFYDSNNDGYICNNDLIRMQQLIKKCPLIKQDYNIIRSGAYRIKFENNLDYLQLYRLSQITQTTYFNWLKKQKNSQTADANNEYNEELKNYFENLNKRKIHVHYEGFKKLFENQKPFLYYDLVWRISGIKYEGLRYQ